MPSSDVAEARRLLEQAESEGDPARKFAALEEGLELLEALADDSATSEVDRILVQNLRTASIRHLLRQLAEMRNVDAGAWLDYVRLLVTRFHAEVGAALDNDETLREGYRRFVSRWGEEFLEILKRDR